MPHVWVVGVGWLQELPGREKAELVFFSCMEEGEGNPRAVEKRQHNLWLFFCSPLILFSADGALATASFCLQGCSLCGDVIWEIPAYRGPVRALVVTSSIGPGCRNPLLCWQICFAVVGALWRKHLLQIVAYQLPEQFRVNQIKASC